MRIVARRKTCHLSGGFYSFPNAEVDDDPREQQAECQVPLDAAQFTHTAGDEQDFAPAAKRFQTLSVNAGGDVGRLISVTTATLAPPPAATTVPTLTVHGLPH